MSRFALFAALFFAVSAVWASPLCAAERSIVDMRGKTIRMPTAIKRVATIDDGFVESVMTHLGVIRSVAAIGSWGMKRDYAYQFETVSGEKYERRGWSTMKFLHPWLDDLPVVNSPQGNVINFEALAKSAPDIVLLRIGDCTITAANKEGAAKTIDAIESMGLPLAVLYSPTCFGGADMSTLKEEMRVIGDLFGQREKAEKLADMQARVEAMIRERTADIPEDKKTRVLYFGLCPLARGKGGSGSVWGVDTPESHIIENVVNAKNAYTGKGNGVPINAEQVYALDPDVIVLPTANGYHPPRELYEASYYANFAELEAVKNKRAYAMPWTPMNCARRLEYPLDMLIIAKAAYPEKFADINVHAFALQMYKNLYGVDEETARGLASTQLLDWMLEHGF